MGFKTLEASADFAKPAYSALLSGLAQPPPPFGTYIQEDENDDDDPCSALEGDYSVRFHVGAVFVVLLASFVGALLPLLGKRISMLRLPHYAYAMGKCLSIGVMLAVALIHMIGETVEMFGASCVPESFAELYESWSFLFAMIAAVLMHVIDVLISLLVEHFSDKRKRGNGSDSGCGLNQLYDKTAANLTLHQPGNASKGSDRRSENEGIAVNTSHELSNGNGDQHMTTSSLGPCGPCKEPSSPPASFHQPGAMDCAHHQHGISIPDTIPQVQRVIAAICMEFGVTLHSVFVGLTLGVSNDQDLKPLLIAMTFHQLFEGFAMGARLAEAEFHLSLEMILMIIFSVSTPVGVAVGTTAISVSRNALSGAGYVMTCAIMESMCGGILLYLSFGLIFVDFPVDMRRLCPKGSRYRFVRIFGMFAALWVGVGVMALIGKWG